MFIICVIHIVGLVLLPVLLLQSSLIRYFNFLHGFYVEIVPGGSEKKDATKTIHQVIFFLKFGISSNYNMLFHFAKKNLGMDDFESWPFGVVEPPTSNTYYVLVRTYLQFTYVPPVYVCTSRVN